MAFSKVPKLPTEHGLKCTMCHQGNLDQTGHHQSVVQTESGEKVTADVFEVTCRQCTQNDAKVAYLAKQEISEEEYSGWGSSPRKFVGFWHRNRNDPTGRGGGKFEHRRFGVKRVEIIEF